MESNDANAEMFAAMIGGQNDSGEKIKIPKNSHEEIAPMPPPSSIESLVMRDEAQRAMTMPQHQQEAELTAPHMPEMPMPQDTLIVPSMPELPQVQPQTQKPRKQSWFSRLFSFFKRK